ncbi:MAG: TrkH family potassium uptake protein [Thermodesulfobacteria bacterium]|nr:TrkH family potassium uptake protein [Thermodesulfobacteriota bacterium]
MFKQLLQNVKERLYIFNYLGTLLVITGLLMLLPLIPIFVYDEEQSLFTFILPAGFSLIAGLGLQLGFPLKKPSVRGAMVITALGWILVGLIGGVPYILGLKKSFIDAFFESVSGFTTTGITVFEHLDSMPKCILFWRAFTQWLGGVGILSFFMAVSFRGGSIAAALFSAEGHKVTVARPAPGIFHTLVILWGIYGFFSILSFILFWLGGMSIFDAITHSFTCISTGGFSTHDASLAYWQQNHIGHPWFLELSTVAIMLAGGANFLIHYRVLQGKVKTIFTDFEMKWYWLFTISAVAVIMLDHFVAFAKVEPLDLQDFFKIFRISLFQVSSLITSTGYLTVDINSPFFPALSKQVLMTLMIIGGCIGSTAGGIKVMRAGILFRLFSLELKRIIRPRRAVLPLVVSGKIVESGEIYRIAALVWGWLAIVMAGAFITAFFSDLDPWQALSGMASAMGNMGPFYFSVHKMASLSWVIKLTYIFGMLAGRLEILPLAVLAAILFRRL